jgi:competence protein ComEC
MVKSAMNRITSFFSELPKRWVVPPLLVAAILASVTAATMPDDNLHVSFLDVGEGDAILIQRGSQDILIDGGPSPQAICLGLGKSLPFWDRTIELVILTHPHSDHLTGLVEVLQRYKVNQVLYPDIDYDLPIYEAWLNLIDKETIKRTIAQAGQQINLGDRLIINVLNPPIPHLTGTESDIDNNGVVLRLSMGRASFLLTADIMEEAEFQLMANSADLSSTVLKVAHHGSNTSTTPQFLAVASPQVAVISSGKGNLFHHPSGEVMKRLEEKLGTGGIYQTYDKETYKHQTIEFITDGERLWVRVGVGR